MFRNGLKDYLAKRGLMIVRSKLRYGFDPWSDIDKLAKAWGYGIDVIFDVGANDGDTANAVLERFADAKVFSFEPSSETFAALTRRMKNHISHTRFQAWPIAIGDFSGITDLYEYDYSKVASMVSDARYAVRFSQTPRSRKEVECTTIDNFCQRKNLDRLDVLKIDTEGCDHLVIQGAQSLLSRRAIKFVLAEFNDYKPKVGASGGALSTIAELLDRHGLRFIATYNDTTIVEEELFSVSNVLFALPPERVGIL